jgi:hypothetical protein
MQLLQNIMDYIYYRQQKHTFLDVLVQFVNHNKWEARVKCKNAKESKSRKNGSQKRNRYRHEDNKEQKRK